MGCYFKFPPPPSERCAFCGKTLSPQGVRIGRAVTLWKPKPYRCDCEKSRPYWAEYDRKRKELEAQEKERERREAVNARISKLLGESGIKKRFSQRTFQNFRRDTEQRDRCYLVAKEYADNWRSHAANGEGLYIEGTNGTGKTHLAAAIALQLIGQGVPVICKTGDDLLKDIKKTFDTPGVTENEALDIYRNVDLLIVDDLGKEQCSDWSVSTLYGIFNDRYEAMRPVIITTNYGVEDLTRALTPKGGDSSKIVAIISRLQETSRVLTMVGPDIRRGQ